MSIDDRAADALLPRLVQDRYDLIPQRFEIELNYVPNNVVVHDIVGVN